MPQITSFEGKSVQPTSEVYPIANKWLVSVYMFVLRHELTPKTLLWLLKYTSVIKAGNSVGAVFKHSY